MENNESKLKSFMRYMIEKIITIIALTAVIYGYGYIVYLVIMHLKYGG